jgi:hypothetical protein
LGGIVGSKNGFAAGTQIRWPIQVQHTNGNQPNFIRNTLAL